VAEARAAGGGRGRAKRRRRRPNLRVVKPPGRARRLPFLVASFLLVGALVVGVTTVQALVSQTSFRMQDLSTRTTELQREYGRLRLDVARLSSPERIAREARHLGLTLPGPGDVRTLYVDDPGSGSGGAASGGQPSFALKGVLGSQP
jgi:cell division protein FtsL